MTLDDREFITAFEGCTLPGSSFHHREHVRLAWLYLRAHAEDEAERLMAEGIRRYATSLGAAAKYHHTLSVFWMRACAGARRLTPGLASFEDFAGTHPELLDKDLVDRYYSRGVLDTPAAKSGWIAPDLRPLD